jgi:hypothetical protein
MSITIIGGLDRMVCRYKDICKEQGCKAKVCTQPRGDLECVIGSSDLIVLFTSLVSHSMVKQAKKAAAANKIKLVQSHNGSGRALRNIILQHRG